MKVVIQCTTHASVTINQKIKSSIVNRLLVLVDIEGRDTNEDIKWLAGKIVNLEYSTMKTA